MPAQNQEERRRHAELLDQGGDWSLPIGSRVEQGLDDASLVVASLATPLPKENRGYAMLQLMGWKGQGLGRQEQGAHCRLGTSGRGRPEPLAACPVHSTVQARWQDAGCWVASTHRRPAPGEPVCTV